MNTKIFLAFFSCLLVMSSQAQIRKGSILPGGDLGYNDLKFSVPAGKEQRIYFFQPVVGFAIKDNLAAGIKAHYSNWAQDDTDLSPEETKGHAFGGGLFLRKYKELGKNFYLFGELGADYNFEQREELDGFDVQMRNRQYRAGIGINPGLSYAIKNRFHLELAINRMISLEYTKNIYENMTPPGTIKSESRGFYFNSNLFSISSFNIGFRVVLGK